MAGSLADIEAASAILDTAAVTLLQLEVPLDAVAAAAAAPAAPYPQPGTCSVGTLPMSLLADVDVLVPNQTELATIAGHDGPVDRATAAELQPVCRASSVIVTLGAEGALVVLDGEATHVPAPVVRPVDTTAAGDCSAAPSPTAWCAGLDLVEATRWAVRVGAATTQRPGAQPSLPTTRRGPASHRRRPAACERSPVASTLCHAPRC